MYKNEYIVYETLNLLEIKYDKYEHGPVYTIKECHDLEFDIKGKHAKNLFLRNKKGNKHYLAIIEESKNIDLKLLANKIGESNLSFASEERLEKYLNLKPGCVGPFGLLNDTKKEVIVLIDNDLVCNDKISFHPNINTVTISILYEDFEKFIKWNENDINYI